MPRTLSYCQPDHIEVRFRHADEFDFINLDIRLVGDITLALECEDQSEEAEPVRHEKATTDFTVYMSSVFCTFRDFIRFLEAITLEVQECAFGWEAEGPDGRMRWKRRYVEDVGFLTIEWDSYKEKFSHRMMLDTRQAVRVLYSAFRIFVDSPDYDPLRYEKLTYGESFALILSDASLEDLATRLAQMSAAAARVFLHSLANAVYDRHEKGPKLNFPIEFFERATEPVDPSSSYHDWINPQWDNWDIDQRMNQLKELFSWNGMSRDGENLRQMRSQLIEDWLALPEPVATKNKGSSGS